MSLNMTIGKYRVVLVLIALIWAIEMINQIAGHHLNQLFGLRPRALAGLIGIPAMPLLHTGLGHALANTVPLAILGGIGVLVAPQRLVAACVLMILLTGIAVWILGRPGTVHVGASGLIFALFGYVVALGAIERSLRALAGATVALLAYGSVVVSLSGYTGIAVSWEAHLFGAVSGVLTALALHRRKRRAR